MLFDENLAARLVAALADLYRTVPMSAIMGWRGSDHAIRQDARDKKLVIVTKDEDFQRL